MLGQNHIFEIHKDRKERNVIINLTWNVEDDAKKYAILQDLEEKRNLILKYINDENKVQDATIPEEFKIGKSSKTSVLLVKPTITAILDDNSSELDDLEKIEHINKELEKKFRNFMKSIHNVIMSKEVETTLKNKQGVIDQFLTTIDQYLGIKKALNILEVFLKSAKSK